MQSCEECCEQEKANNHYSTRVCKYLKKKEQKHLRQNDWSHYLRNASGERKWGEIECADKEMLRLTKENNRKLNEKVDDLIQQLD